MIELLMLIPLVMILMFMLFGLIVPKPYSDSLRDELRRAEEQRDRLHRDIDTYIDRLAAETRPELRPAPRSEPESEETKEQGEKLADVRNRAFPPPDPATANPEMEPYYPPPPSWDGFTRQYPPLPPPQQGDKQ